MKVYLVCTYDSYYPEGPERDVLSVHLTEEGADAALAAHKQRGRRYSYDHEYVLPVNVQP